MYVRDPGYWYYQRISILVFIQNKNFVFHDILTFISATRIHFCENQAVTANWIDNLSSFDQ